MGCSVIDVDHGSRVVVYRYDPVAAAGTDIRRRLRVVFDDWGLAEDTVDDALLLVEELVTNVVDHARTPFRLLVRLDGGVLHIAAHDRSSLPVRVQELDRARPRGRGLLVIAGVSTRWGSDTDGTGKTVWADLAV
jgi:anti-sigma regulatory factor (Ser/Thr protein kinase)